MMRLLLILLSFITSVLCDVTDPNTFNLPNGFHAELVCTPKQDSWISICSDHKGRLYISNEKDGLIRITLPEMGRSSELKIEKIEIETGPAHGLLWAFNSLFVTSDNYKGKRALLKLNDEDKNDRIDSLEVLKIFEGKGGHHSIHGLALSPSDNRIYMIAGDTIKLPNEVLSYSKSYREDQIIKKDSSSTGYGTGVEMPNGWVCSFDQHGKDWRLHSCGLRNAYDLAFNHLGQLFTFDSDMETDTGMPWYRKTAIYQLIPGADYGWRTGSGNLPPIYQDILDPVLNIGLGSPTGICFGTNSNFPLKYQKAGFFCDWSYGKMYAVHFKKIGDQYKAIKEDFLSGLPLPLTDVIINPIDKNMYFTIGGRGTQSALYKVTYIGEKKNNAETINIKNETIKKREMLEMALIKKSKTALKFALNEGVQANDNYIKYSSRILLENYPDYIEYGKEDLPLEASYELAMALVRSGRLSNEQLNYLLSRKPKSQQEKLSFTRICSLVLLRCSALINQENKSKIEQSIKELYSSYDHTVNIELSKVLIHLKSKDLILNSKIIFDSMDIHEKLALVWILKNYNNNPSKDEIRLYLEWWNEVYISYLNGEIVGANHTSTYLKRFKEEFIKDISIEIKKEFKSLINQEFDESRVIPKPDPKKVSKMRFVKNWQLKDFDNIPDLSANRNLERGQELFALTNCIQCHRYNNIGGVFGPDLTLAGSKYSPLEIIRECIEPSYNIVESYSTSSVTTKEGVVTGRIQSEDKNRITLITNPLSGDSSIQIDRNNILSIEKDKISTMPPGLMNILNKEEIYDLLAYIIYGKKD